MPKCYAIAYDSGKFEVLRKWEDVERKIRGWGDRVRYKKFAYTLDAQTWGEALADWLRRRSLAREVLKIENEFDDAVRSFDERYHN